MAAGRRQARHTVRLQAAAAMLAALVSGLLQGPQAALAAGIGGGAIALGNALMAWRAFGSGAPGAGLALGRLIGGLALKWLVILAALLIALAGWKLPPVPLLAGLGAALVAGLFAFRFKT